MNKLQRYEKMVSLFHIYHILLLVSSMLRVASSPFRVSLFRTNVCYHHDWISVSSKKMHSHLAVKECIDALNDELAGEEPFLVTIFYGAEHISNGSLIAKTIWDETKARNVIGCSSGAGILTNKQDMELGSSMTLTAIPFQKEPRIVPFYATNENLPCQLETVEPRTNTKEGPHFILFSEPAFPIENFVKNLETRYPNSAILGACCYGERDAENDEVSFSAITNKHSYKNALVGISIENHPMALIQSVGCETFPELPLMEVTSCDEHYIRSLDNERSEDIQLKMIGELQKREMITDQSILLMGCLHKGINHLDEEMINSPNNYSLRSLNEVMGKQQSFTEKPGILMPISAFCEEGDFIRYWIKHPDSCLRSWKPLKKQIEKEFECFSDLGLPRSHVSPENQDMLMFLSHGRGKMMHGKTSVETSEIRNLFPDCQLNGVFTANEILNTDAKVSRSNPHVSTLNAVGVWFPKE